MREVIKVLSFALVVGLLVGCSKDEDASGSKSDGSIFDKNKVTKPTIKHVVCTTTTTDFDVTYRVTSEESPQSVVLHYVAFNKKASNVKKSDCKNISYCHYFEPVGKTNYNCRFRHTGFNAGYYIYYYCEATNSAGTTESNVTYQIFKR